MPEGLVREGGDGILPSKWWFVSIMTEEHSSGIETHSRRRHAKSTLTPKGALLQY